MSEEQVQYGNKKQSNLHLRFLMLAEDYLQEFSIKQDIEFSYWVGNNIGGVACFIEQYFFDFNDIRFDIDNNIPKHTILNWHDDGIEHNINKKNQNYINYKSYTKGLRYETLNK